MSLENSLSKTIIEARSAIVFPTGYLDGGRRRIEEFKDELGKLFK